MADTLTTELEAVNVMLGTIGEAPINSLSGTLPADVSTAVAILKEVRRKVLSLGWWFNIDYGVQSTLDGSNNIVLATNVVRADLTYANPDIILVQRGVRLYNAKTQTYVFTQAPKLDLTYLLDWIELPEQARQYIMHRAARIFQARLVGAPELDQSASRDELIALAELKSADSDAANHNIFNNHRMARLYRYRRH